MGCVFKYYTPAKPSATPCGTYRSCDSSHSCHGSPERYESHSDCEKRDAKLCTSVHYKPVPQEI